jgi:hypothetical protein
MRFGTFEALRRLSIMRHVAQSHSLSAAVSEYSTRRRGALMQTSGLSQEQR